MSRKKVSWDFHFMVPVSQLIKCVDEEAKRHNDRGLSLLRIYLVPCFVSMPTMVPDFGFAGGEPLQRISSLEF